MPFFSCVGSDMLAVQVNCLSSKASGGTQVGKGSGQTSNGSVSEKARGKGTTVGLTCWAVCVTENGVVVVAVGISTVMVR